MDEKQPWWQKIGLILAIITLINFLFFSWLQSVGAFDRLDRFTYDWICKMKTGDWENPCIYPYPERGR